MSFQEARDLTHHHHHHHLGRQQNERSYNAEQVERSELISPLSPSPPPPASTPLSMTVVPSSPVREHHDDYMPTLQELYSDELTQESNEASFDDFFKQVRKVCYADLCIKKPERRFEVPLNVDRPWIVYCGCGVEAVQSVNGDEGEYLCGFETPHPPVVGRDDRQTVLYKMFYKRFMEQNLKKFIEEAGKFTGRVLQFQDTTYEKNPISLLLFYANPTCNLSLNYLDVMSTFVEYRVSPTELKASSTYIKIPICMNDEHVISSHGNSGSGGFFGVSSSVPRSRLLNPSNVKVLDYFFHDMVALNKGDKRQVYGKLPYVYIDKLKELIAYKGKELRSCFTTKVKTCKIPDSTRLPISRKKSYEHYLQDKTKALFALSMCEHCSKNNNFMFALCEGNPILRPPQQSQSKKREADVVMIEGEDEEEEEVARVEPRHERNQFVLRGDEYRKLKRR